MMEKIRAQILEIVLPIWEKVKPYYEKARDRCKRHQYAGKRAYQLAHLNPVYAEQGCVGHPRGCKKTFKRNYIQSESTSAFIS